MSFVAFFGRCAQKSCVWIFRLRWSVASRHSNAHNFYVVYQVEPALAETVQKFTHLRLFFEARDLISHLNMFPRDRSLSGISEEIPNSNFGTTIYSFLLNFLIHFSSILYKIKLHFLLKFTQQLHTNSQECEEHSNHFSRKLAKSQLISLRFQVHSFRCCISSDRFPPDAASPIAEAVSALDRRANTRLSPRDRCCCPVILHLSGCFFRPQLRSSASFGDASVSFLIFGTISVVYKLVLVDLGIQLLVWIIIGSCVIMLWVIGLELNW